MLVELLGGNVILSHDGIEYYPDDRMPDRRTADEFCREMEGLPEDLRERFLNSKQRRSFRHPKNELPPLVAISGKVTLENKAKLRVIAEGMGKTLSAYIADLLNAQVEPEAGEPLSDVIDPYVALIEEARASVALDHDERMQTHSTQEAPDA